MDLATTAHNLPHVAFDMIFKHSDSEPFNFTRIDIGSLLTNMFTFQIKRVNHVVSCLILFVVPPLHPLFVFDSYLTILNAFMV